MSECNEPVLFSEDERAFLETYSMLLRLLFAPHRAGIGKDDEGP